MYAALWRVLPGPWWARVIVLLIAVALVLSVLVVFVFPWFDQFVAPQDVTVSR